jgi:hypothetical protein
VIVVAAGEAIGMAIGVAGIMLKPVAGIGSGVGITGIC